MADIKDFSRNPLRMRQEEPRDERDKQNLQSKINRHRMLNFYKFCFMGIVIVGIVVLIYIQWKRLVYTDYEVVQQNEWTKSEEAHSMELKGTILTYSKDGMTCTDTKGNAIWNQTYEMQSPIVRTCQNVVAIGDYNGRSIYVANTSQIIGRIDTTMPIREFCVSANGVVAAVLDDSTVTAISVCSIKGEHVYFKTTMSKSGYPIAIDITDDGQQVAVSYLKAENGKIVSNIGFYNFSSVGQNYTDNLVGAYGCDGAVVPVVSFMNNNTCFALADNKLMFYQGRQKPVSLSDIWLSDEVQSVFYNENYVGLVFYNTEGEQTYRLDVYDTNGTQRISIPFELKYQNIIFQDAGIVIHNENQCLIYSWENLMKYEGTFKEPIRCFVPSGSIDRYMLVTDDSIQHIRLR